MVEPRRRQVFAEFREIAPHIVLHRLSDGDGAGHIPQRAVLVLAALSAQFCLDNLGGDEILRIKRGDSTDKIFKFTHVAGPRILLELIIGRILETLCLEPFLFGLNVEMTHQIGNVFRPVPQWRQPQRNDIETVVEVFAKQALIDG